MPSPSTDDPTPRKDVRAVLRKVAKWGVVTIILGFIGLYVYRHRASLADVHAPDRTLFILATLLAQPNFFVTAWAYQILLKAHGIRIPFRMAAGLYFIPALGKYIPGKLWSVAGALQLFHLTGLPKARASAALMMHMVIVLAVTVLIAIGFGASSLAPNVSIWSFVAALAVLAVLASPKVFYGFFNLALRLTGRQPMEHSAGYRDLLATTFVLVIGRLMYAGGFVLLVGSFYSLTRADIPVLIGTFCFAQVAGVVALFAPAGIGVREGILIYALQPIVGTGNAIAVTGFCRLWQTAMELVVSAYGWFAIRSRL